MPRSAALRSLSGFVIVAGCAALWGCASPTGTAPPTQAPTASPSPGPVEAGAITLTDDDCTWEANPGTVPSGSVSIEVHNETDDYGVFIVQRLKPQFTFEDGREAIAAIQEAIAAGAEWPEWTTERSTIEGEGTAEAGRTGVALITLEEGTIGVVCSANTSPTGDILTVFLAGPLDVTAP
jgi:hypothetical protein